LNLQQDILTTQHQISIFSPHSRLTIYIHKIERRHMAPETWEQRTLGELCSIHDRLVREREELDREIQRLSRSLESVERLEQQRTRRRNLVRHLEDLARIIPLRLIRECAA
jgi:hypothetical protein